MKCTLFSVSQAELLEATGELPAYGDSIMSMSAATSPVGQVLELGEAWRELHILLGNHGSEHPLGFLVAGGQGVPSMDSGGEPSRCFAPNDTIQLLAFVARLDDARVRKLRQFLADAVLAHHGVIVHHLR